MKFRWKIFAKSEKIIDWRSKVIDAIENNKKLSMEEVKEIIKSAPKEELEKMLFAAEERLAEISKKNK